MNTRMIKDSQSITDFCTLQWQKEPWKRLVATHVYILRYIADFWQALINSKDTLIMLLWQPWEQTRWKWKRLSTLIRGQLLLPQVGLINKPGTLHLYQIFSLVLRTGEY